MSSSGWVDVRGTRIRVLEGGADGAGGESAALLYLHGGSGGGEWLPCLEALSQHYRVFAPEHPGFGESDDLKGVDSTDSMEDLAFFYLDFLDQMGIDKVAVMGSSIGGWLAVELAVLAPHRITKLILLGAAGVRVEGVELPDVFMLDEQAYGQLLFHDPLLIEKRLAAVADDGQVLVQNRNRAAQAHLAWNPYYHRPKLRQRLHRVKMPTLLIWGAQDRIFPPAVGEEYVRLLPDAKLRVLADCGHLPAQEKATEVVQLAQSFLTEGSR